jgi:hypothetical protein
MGKTKNSKIRKVGFLEYLKKNLKYLYKDIVLSGIFIILSSTKPVLSLSNGAWYVLLWYIISLFSLLEVCRYNFNYNIECKAKKKWHTRHGYKNQTKEEKSKIINYKKANVELGGWTFLWIKILVSLLFQIIFIVIAIKHQFNDYNNYMNSEKNFFFGVFMDTFVITICTGYYSLIIDNMRVAKGFRGKILSIISKRKIIQRIDPLPV